MSTGVATASAPRTAALAVLLIGTTLGEGGATPTALLAWHAGLAILLGLELWAPRRANGVSTGIASGPAAAFLAYVGVAVLGATLAPYTYAAWLFLFELGCFVGVAWIAARRDGDLLSRLSGPLLLAAAAQAGLLLVQRYALGHTRPSGTFLNPNHLSAWIAAALLLAWADPLVRREVSRRRALILAAPTAMALAALVVTGSRGAALGVAVGLAVVAVHGFRAWPPAWRRGATAVGFLLLVLAAIGLGARMRQPDPFRHQRTRIWTASLAVLAEDAWLGSGPRQFGDAARRHQFPDGDGPLRHDRGFRTTHSDWLRVPCELGWPAAIALLASLWLGCRHVILRSRRDAAEGRSTHRVGGLAALAALLAQAAVENLSTRPAVYLLAGVVAGSLLSSRRQCGAGRSWGARLFATAMLLGVFAIGEAAPYLGWRALRAASASPAGPAHEQALSRALSRNPIHPDYWRRRAESLVPIGGAWSLEGYAAAREAGETAVRLNPAGAEFHRALARIEARACRMLFPDRQTRDRAVAAYLRAEALDPFNPFLPLERGALLLDTDDAASAIRAAERALQIEPESVTPRLLLAAAWLESGAVEAPARASALLREARDAAERWDAWATSGDYARDLLTLDPRVVAEIERGIGRGGRDADCPG